MREGESGSWPAAGRRASRSEPDRPPRAPSCCGSEGAARRPACSRSLHTDPAVLRGWGNKRAYRCCTCPQMNMSSVASEICLLPFADVRADARHDFFLGQVDLRVQSRAGRSGTAGRSRLSSPLRRRSCVSRAQGYFPDLSGGETSTSRGRFSPRTAFRNNSRVSA